MNRQRNQWATRGQWTTWGGVAVLAAAAAAGCSQAGGAGSTGKSANTKPAASENTPRVQTVSVQPQDLARKIELPGTVEGYETADLYAKVGGFLEEISVDIGDHVTKGQVLARLSIPEMERELAEKQAAIAAAEANVEQSKAALHEAKTELREKEAQLNQQVATFERTKDLVDRGSLQQKLLDEATYQRDAAQAALETVRARIQSADASLNSSVAKVDLARAERDRIETLIEYGEIRAPFDGMVMKRFVDPGAFIQPADGNSAARPLLTITRIDVVRIWLDLPMAEVRWLNRGDRVVFDRINVLPGVMFEGEVTRFVTGLDPTSRMMRVEVDLANPERQLLPGYYGYVTVFLDEMPQTPVVPSSALLTSGTQTYVCVVRDGICRRQPVSVSFQDGTIVGVDSGLTPGEQVVQAGGGQLRDGQQVVAVNAGA
jgi:RND family efflux transporter MFP subunit